LPARVEQGQARVGRGSERLKAFERLPQLRRSRLFMPSARGNWLELPLATVIQKDAKKMCKTAHVFIFNINF